MKVFLDEIGECWIPLELNPWKVAAREMSARGEMTPCISPVFMETFFKDRVRELSPERSKVVNLSAENFFRLTSVMEWSNKCKEHIRKQAQKIDSTFIGRVAQDRLDYEKSPSTLDKTCPQVPYTKEAPARFALLQLIRQLVLNAKQDTLKKGDGRDLCHAVLGSAYGSIAALDKQWKRRVGALPKPNGLARIYFAGELDQLVADLGTVAKQRRETAG